MACTLAGRHVTTYARHMVHAWHMSLMLRRLFKEIS